MFPAAVSGQHFFRLLPRDSGTFFLRGFLAYQRYGRAGDPGKTISVGRDLQIEVNQFVHQKGQESAGTAGRQTLFVRSFGHECESGYTDDQNP